MLLFLLFTVIRYSNGELLNPYTIKWNKITLLECAQNSATGNCYVGTESWMTNHEARAQCQLRGGFLPVIETPLDLNFLRDLSGDDVWVNLIGEPDRYCDTYKVH
jgi:hypothetical protein